MRGALILFVAATAGCAPPPSVEDFRRDPRRAEQVLAECTAGRRSGPQCDNAHAGATAARRDARLALYRKGF